MDLESELDRRRATVARQETDRIRWSDPSALETSWTARAEIAAGFIPRGARVLDLGCGAMALERFLPEGCVYIPCDLVARDDRTIVCDFNGGEFPDDVACDVVVALGVLEYLTDVPGFLKRMRALDAPTVLTYNLGGEGPADRAALGWINAYRRPDLPGLLTGAGFTRAVGRPLSPSELMMRLEPDAPPRVAEREVWVLSASNHGNFGDRLGVHLLSQVLPPHAVVRHFMLDPLDAPPEGAPDLLIVGIGNSLYGELLSDELIALVERAPAAIGIFGTQYRETLPTGQLHRLVDALDIWFARYEEDVLLYGQGRPNVRHLGDWLIDAFPMAQATSDVPLTIGKEVLGNEPLDRTIERIQRHVEVTSSRLHPLLCALTSAQRVAYAEQREFDSINISGKFRSMLMDVFGRDMPADQLWSVDRSAVIAYKTRVRANIDALRRQIVTLLDRADARAPGAPAIQTKDKVRFEDAARLHAAGELGGAETAYRAILDQDPDADVVRNNLFLLLESVGRYADGEALLREALKRRPDDPSLTFRLASAILADGRFAEGWPLYESRLNVPSVAPHVPRLTIPVWAGQPVDRLLVWSEQGFGDAIQFARYANLLKARAGEVTLLCQAPLARLLQPLEVKVVGLSAEVKLPAQDAWTPLGSLPLHFQTTLETIPPPFPVRALAGGRKLDGRIGIATRGRPSHANDAHRSLPDAESARLLSIPGAVSLHPEDTGARDFQDTADMIAGLDQVISVDTSVAHLAASMGKPTTVLLPALNRDWRWLRGRLDSPWYPAMRLRHQPRLDGWADLVSALLEEFGG